MQTIVCSKKASDSFQALNTNHPLCLLVCQKAVTKIYIFPQLLQISYFFVDPKFRQCAENQKFKGNMNHPPSKIKPPALSKSHLSNKCNTKISRKKVNQLSWVFFLLKILPCSFSLKLLQNFLGVTYFTTGDLQKPADLPRSSLHQGNTLLTCNKILYF